MPHISTEMSTELFQMFIFTVIGMFFSKSDISVEFPLIKDQY